MTYPEEFFRGIPRSDFLDSEGRASANLFQFDDNPSREIEYQELSINWNDDDGAKDEILNKRKEGNDDYQFPVGYAVMLRSRLDLIMTANTCIDRIKYERYPVEGNDYHGNILMIKGLDKQQRILMRGQVAFCVDRIVRREDG